MSRFSPFRSAPLPKPSLSDAVTPEQTEPPRASGQGAAGEGAIDRRPGGQRAMGQGAMGQLAAGQRVVVKVPATSGNLGPGFDALGLAYDIYDIVEVEITDGATTIEVAGEGQGEVPLDEQHLVLRALRRTFDVVNVPQPNVRLRCENYIPHGRGMGSSAAAVVAGITAANALLPQQHQLTRDQVLELATEFEGHPDNAAPAIYGGATVSWLENGQPQGVRLPVAPEIQPILFVPEIQLATKAARAVLPAQVPFADAAANVGRAALLVAALGGETQHLMAATEDKLHQPYRAAVMPESAKLMESLRENGVAAVISGAGPTVLALNTYAADQHKCQIIDNGNPNAIVPEKKEALTEKPGIDLTGWRILRPEIDQSGAKATHVLP